MSAKVMLVFRILSTQVWHHVYLLVEVFVQLPLYWLRLAAFVLCVFVWQVACVQCVCSTACLLCAFGSQWPWTAYVPPCVLCLWKPV